MIKATNAPVHIDKMSYYSLPDDGDRTSSLQEILKGNNHNHNNNNNVWFICCQ